MIDTLRSVSALVDDKNDRDRSITFRLNTDDIDDRDTVILPSGGRFDHYRSIGGPVLWDHGLDPRRGKDPIGTNLEIGLHGTKRPVIRAKDTFLRDDFSQQRYEWYRGGVLRGVSIRFRRPNEGDYGPPTNDEIRARPELERLRSVWRDTEGKRGFVLRRWDLAEHSCTPLPSNPNALSVSEIRSVLECCRAGMWLPEEAVATLKRRATQSSPGRPTVRAGVEDELLRRDQARITRQVLPNVMRKLAHTEVADSFRCLPDGRVGLFARNGELIDYAADIASASLIVHQGRETRMRLEAAARRCVLHS